MNILITSALAFMFWLFLKRVFIPRIKKSSFSKSKFGELAKIGWLSVMSYLRRLSLIIAITYLGLWLLFESLSLTIRISHNDGILNGVFKFLNRFYEFLASIDTSKFYFILVILLIVFALLIYRNAKKFGKTIYSELYKKYQDGALPYEAPSERMAELAQSVEKAEEEYERLSSIDVSKLTKEEGVDFERQYEYLKTIIWALKYQHEEENIRRRIIPSIEKVDNHNESNNTLKKQILRFFTSKGLINTLYRTSRGISNIGIAFILMSFIAASKTIIQTDANTKMTSIVELKLQAEKQELDIEWQKSLVQNIPVDQKINSEKSSEESLEEWSEEDEEMLNDFSRTFEVQFARAISQGIQISNKQSAFTAKANAVKQNIIKTYASNSDGSRKKGFKVQNQGGFNTSSDKKTEYSKKFSDDFARNINSKEPKSSIGKKFKEDLKKELLDNKSLKSSLAEKIKSARSSFTKTASLNEVIGLLLGESFDGALSGGNALSSTSIGRDILSNMTEIIGEKTIRTFSQKKGMQFRNDLVNKTVQEAIGDISKYNGEIDNFVADRMSMIKMSPSVHADEIINTLSGYEPALEFEALSKENISKSKNAVRNLASLNVDVGLSSAESLADFRHYFPSQIGADLTTATAEITGEILSEAAAVSVELADNFKTPNYSTSRKNVGRARSFKGLKGFRRIGGVLIGQEASNSGNTNVNFNNISWKTKGQKLEIFLHREDNKIISAGIYDKDIVHQSLTYAADGRPIAVTMVQGNPMPFFKILVHPSLVDTDLGCKAIGLDRLVDKYANDKSNRKINEAILSYSYQEMLYKYVSLKLIANEMSTSSFELEAPLIELKVTLSKKWNQISTVLNFGEVLQNMDSSHLKYKPNYFNPTVVNAIRQNLQKSNGNFRKFDQLTDEILLESEAESLILCQTELWSGVRELPFEVDENLSFLKPSEKQNLHFFPLSFIRQVSYSPLDNESIFEEDSSIDRPWEFPDLKKDHVIENTLWAGLRTDSEDLKVLEHMKFFTLLQRIFRTALNGDLGLNFPTEKLMELAEQTNNSVIYTPTPTWNSSGLTWDLLKKEFPIDANTEIVKSMKEIWFSQEIEDPKNLKPCN